MALRQRPQPPPPPPFPPPAHPAPPPPHSSTSTTSTILNGAETLERKIERSLLVLWEELPPWQRDNAYILSGYRRASNSYRGSLTSVVAHLHNESVNIWTHLLGALAFAVTGVVLYCALVAAARYHRDHDYAVMGDHYRITGEHYTVTGYLQTAIGDLHTATGADVVAFSCFFVGAVGCLGMSATYHALSNHSARVACIGNKLDYAGIVLLIWGSFVASVYYGFFCHARLRWIYWSMISFLGIGCLAVSILPKFRTPEWRPYRAAMFVAMGLSAVFPVLHGWRLFGVAQLQRQIGLSWLVLQGALYILGATIYAARIPERLKPGRFDIWGSSHQIFHVLVVAAAMAHLVGLLKAFDYNHAKFGMGC